MPAALPPAQQQLQFVLLDWEFVQVGRDAPGLVAVELQVLREQEQLLVDCDPVEERQLRGERARVERSLQQLEVHEPWPEVRLSVEWARPVLRVQTSVQRLRLQPPREEPVGHGLLDEPPAVRLALAVLLRRRVRGRRAGRAPGVGVVEEDDDDDDEEDWCRGSRGGRRPRPADGRGLRRGERAFPSSLSLPSLPRFRRTSQPALTPTLPSLSTKKKRRTKKAFNNKVLSTLPTISGRADGGKSAS